jgi:hypothetical protein
MSPRHGPIAHVIHLDIPITAGVGIGKAPPVYLKPGDVMEVSITGLGTLKNVIASADEQAPPCEPVRAKSSVMASL